MREQAGESGKKKRRAGILLPVSALPAPYGVGTFGERAYRFVDWLKGAGMKIWQVLPLLPTNYGDSPYQSCSSDALNYYFIDFDLLQAEGLLKKSEYASLDWGGDEKRVDYGKLFTQKAEVLKLAFARFDRAAEDWKKFLSLGEYADFALFMSLKTRFGYLPWTKWPEEYRRCDEETLLAYRREYAEEIEFWQFTQYLALKQWNALKAYAHENGVLMMGDMPIYVAYDSVELWKYGKELFLLGERGEPSLVAGVPPDAFCDGGQLWGNPVYDWEKMKENGYSWWKRRIDKACGLFDIVRIDHFRGFDRFYAIPAGAEDARGGEWLPGPGAELFRNRENLPIVAEDLGIIDDGVRRMMEKTGYPGMKVLEFAFDGNPANEYLPSTYAPACVAYTGTHDNLPFRAYIEALSQDARRAFEAAFKKECEKAGVAFLGDTAADLCQSAVRLLFASAADTVVIPLHDMLCLGEEARINFPSTLSPLNWSYRFGGEAFAKEPQTRLKALAAEYER